MNRRPGRSMWTTTLRESALFVLIERYGSSMPLCKTQLVNRASPCFAELAWIVLRVPAWPVFRWDEKAGLQRDALRSQ